MFDLVTHQADRSVWRNSLPVKNILFTDCCCCTAVNWDQQLHFISLQCRINQNAACSYASDPVALSGFCVIKFFVQWSGTSECKMGLRPALATSHLFFLSIVFFPYSFFSRCKYGRNTNRPSCTETKEHGRRFLYPDSRHPKQRYFVWRFPGFVRLSFWQD